MAEGVVLEADRAHKPERPKDAQRRRRRRDEHNREPAEEEGGEGQNQTIADELVDAFIGVTVAHPLQPDRHRAGERTGELHIGMLGRRRPGGGHQGLGDVGLLLHQRPVIGDEEEERFGIGREQLPDDQRVLEGLLAGHLKALGRRGAAGQDRFVEAEDIERWGPVEPGDPRHRIERFEPLHDMPQCRSPPTRERCRALHHHDRIGPPESRPPAAASPPAPWRIDAGCRGWPSRGTGLVLVAGSLGICLPPGSVPRPLGPAWIAVARGRQRRKAQRQQKTEPGVVDDRRKGSGCGREPRSGVGGGVRAGPVPGWQEISGQRRPRIARTASSRVTRPSASASRIEKE